MWNKYLMAAGVVGIALAGAACSDKATAETKNAVEKSAAVASSTGAEVTDSWITAKIKAKFADETALEGSKISVETDDHVVSLRGTVLSDAGKARAVAIARGTERVTRVVDRLVVG
jgi:osmotically-inducible protein OsmY